MKTNFRVSEELNQNIHIEEETIDDVSNTEPIEYIIDQSNIGVNESIEATGNAEEDPLLIIDQPNIISDVDELKDEAERIDNVQRDEGQNVILIPGLPERNIGGRPAHGKLICQICGFTEKQKCRLIAHIDGHSNEKRYECKWIDQNGIACGKKYLRQRELTAHQRLKNHRQN